MARHVKALTYADKIDAVRSGTCRQTIRAVGKRPVCVGDTITFHGWTDRPYKSPWSWRLVVEVTEVTKIYIDEVRGIGLLYLAKSNLIDWNSWDSPLANQLAEKDYINPPIGDALKDVLFDLNKSRKWPEQYQIIQW